MFWTDKQFFYDYFLLINIYFILIIQTAASVAQEQIEADDDTSMQQRVLMSTGTVLGGVAEVVGEENEIAGGEAMILCMHPSLLVPAWGRGYMHP